MSKYSLAEELAEVIVDGMDTIVMAEFVRDTLIAGYKNLSEEELVNLAREYAPHLIDKEEV